MRTLKAWQGETMAYRRRPNNSKKTEFYSNKPNISVPDFPQPSAEDTVRSVPQTQGITADTAFSKVRSYDAHLAKIDIKYVGCAPIFGPLNPVQTLNLPQSQGLFTGSINNIYFQDHLKLLSSVTRQIYIDYHGIPFTPLYHTNDTGEWDGNADSGIADPGNPGHNYNNLQILDRDTEDKRMAKAVYAFNQNVNTIIAQLTASQLTDLNINNWDWQPAYQGKNTTYIYRHHDGTTTSEHSLIDRFSNYNQVYSVMSHMLITYQMHLITLMTSLVNFEYLVSQLPKLQELYKSRTNVFIHIQNQLKRSRYTAPIRQLLSWLKRRFIDTYFMSNYILPLSVVSKETDGLNSPLMYLMHRYSTPIQPIVYRSPINKEPSYHTATIMGGIFSQQLHVVKAEQEDIGRIIGVHEHHINPNTHKAEDVNLGEQGFIWTREANLFQVDTLLQIVLQQDTEDNIIQAVNDWLYGISQSIDQLVGNTLDMSNQQWFIDIETALTRLALNPSGITWKQNVDFTSLPPVIKYNRYELVEQLVLFGGSRMVFTDAPNGYTMALPMFRRAGLPSTLIQEYAQAFYAPSDRHYISFIRFHREINFRDRRGERFTAEWRYLSDYNNIEVPYAPHGYDLPILHVDTFQADDYWAMILQVLIPAVYDQQNLRLRVNQDWMTTVVASFQNKSDEIMITLAKNFLIPSA